MNPRHILFDDQLDIRIKRKKKESHTPRCAVCNPRRRMGGTSFEADRMQKNYLIAAEDQWQKRVRETKRKKNPQKTGLHTTAISTERLLICVVVLVYKELRERDPSLTLRDVK